MIKWLKQKIKIFLYSQIILNLLAIIFSIVEIIHFTNAMLIFGLVQIPISLLNWLLIGFFIYQYISSFSRKNYSNHLLFINHIIYLISSFVCIILIYKNALSSVGLILNIVLNIYYLGFNGLGFTKNINLLEG